MTEPHPLAARVASGERLSRSDAEGLLHERDLLVLGMLADEARRRHGDRVTFVRVAQVRVDRERPSTLPSAAGEIRIVGAPDSVEVAGHAIASVRAMAGPRPVTGFALDDLEALADREGRSLVDLLRELSAAGLERVAAAPLDGLRDAMAATRAVQAAGLRIGAAGFHELPPTRWIDRLRDVVAVQDATGMFDALAPLPGRVDPSRPSTGYDDVRLVALARLVVDNIRTIQVDWALYGSKLAQVALTFGANDVDNVSPYDTLDLGARRAPVEEIRRNVRAAQLVALQRNGRFELLEQ